MSESQPRVPPDDEKKKTDESSSVDNGEQLPPKEPELVDGGYGVSNVQPCSAALVLPVMDYSIVGCK